jgi:diaminohydroxyphosphoribosylaminopyrimidine deaminase/5-amino-6-(5-phosphoribosylamino)uracil reductase
MDALYQLNIQSVLVEGGPQFLQSFIDDGIWDEIRKIENEELKIENGLTAPRLSNAIKIKEQKLLNDKIEVYKRKDSD